jgi:hypothetical protein
MTLNNMKLFSSYYKYSECILLSLSYHQEAERLATERVTLHGAGIR